jgi:hypothetical protein
VNDTRIQELLDLATQEGFVLALPPEQIIEIENLSFIVDLRTGAIVGTNEDWFSLTPEAELAYCWLLPDITAVQT